MTRSISTGIRRACLCLVEALARRAIDRVRIRDAGDTRRVVDCAAVAEYASIAAGLRHDLEDWQGRNEWETLSGHFARRGLIAARQCVPGPLPDRAARAIRAGLY